VLVPALVASHVRIRAVGADDADLLREFDGRLSAASRQFRYLGWVPPMTSEVATVLATPDLHYGFALVAVSELDGDRRIVGDCRLTAMPGQTGGAEVSIAVADEYQGVGLGRALMEGLMAAASGRGVTSFIAQVRSDNHRMLRLLRRLGFRRTGSELGVHTFTRHPGALAT
jgi:acetyltransferase